MGYYTWLQVGRTYELRGGGEYNCVSVDGLEAVLERVKDKYILTAHGTRMEPDGKIHWDYSTGGHWPKGTQ